MPSDGAPDRPGALTVTCDDGRATTPGLVRRFGLAVVEGPARGATWQSTGDRTEPVREPRPAEAELAIDPTASYAAERERASADFERRYLTALLRLHDGKMVRAAAAAGIDRAYFYRVLRRHGIQP